MRENTGCVGAHILLRVRWQVYWRQKVSDEKKAAYSRDHLSSKLNQGVERWTSKAALHNDNSSLDLRLMGE